MIGPAIGKMGANSQGQILHAAPMPRCCGRIFGHRRMQQGFAFLRMMVEPTCCQNDTLRGVQRADHSILFCHHARDTIVIGQQCLHLGFKNQIDFVIEQRLE